MSERVPIRKADGYQDFGPGTWLRRPEVAPLVCCGFCGTRIALAFHEIASDGTVQPSLVCPTGCGWDVSAQLEGWEAEG
jgi:hypothetical protein